MTLPDFLTEWPGNEIVLTGYRINLQRLDANGVFGSPGQAREAYQHVGPALPGAAPRAVSSLRSELSGQPFPPGEPDDKGVEHRQGAEADGELIGQSIALVSDEGTQQRNHPRVGPGAVLEERHDQDQLGQPVAEQVDGREGGTAVGEVRAVAKQMTGDEVVGIVRKLVLGRRPDQVAEGGWPQEQQHPTADDL